MELDMEAIRRTVVAELPLQSRWTFRDTTIDFRFQRSQPGLRCVSDADVSGGIEAEWATLRVIGEFDVAEGGCARPLIAIRPPDGAVWGLDVEAKRGEEIRYFNSTIERFVQTFHLLDGYLAPGRAVPREVEAKVRRIDPTIYPKSEWKLLLDHLHDA
jgi:hypothetical protein